ncbi:hypothetical protein Plim_4270 (plasmid) [Planctopirus limnophila DSM 3776]|uniref:Uncharacterized protein n=1 Tax=Planctopirus limnophila (strain ATCC 43296 / DSM 3776 / IFAM 1008 / Mu 290) TaxID=521674 RepID=D5SZF7_PLAL2|nr:hypothetical protein [Planctopirus limnophila]ADG70077.1 hypothetical protein Plim_4270 [Planctopirus limnophila DSM 3776]
MTAVMFSQGAARKIRTATERVLGKGPPPPINSTRPSPLRPENRYMGKFVTSLEAPEIDPEIDRIVPTSATFQVWLPDPEQPDVQLIPTDIEMLVYNFDPSLTAEPDIFGKIEYLNGVWSPYWASCE